MGHFSNHIGPFEKRIFISMLMCVGIVFVSEITNIKEILFPEIVALVIGAWASSLQPWKTYKFQIVALMTVSSLIGFIFVNYIHIPVYFKIIIVYLIIGSFLTITESGLFPMISAAVLPILMDTENIIYPVSVFIMSCIVAFVQYKMEKKGIRKKSTYIPFQMKKNERIKLWIKRTIVLAFAIIIPFILKLSFIFAPPLLVFFTESTVPNSKIRNTPIKSCIIISLTAFIGSFSRIILCIKFHLPLTVAALVTITLVFLTFKIFDQFIPPAGAIAFLPFIISEKSLYSFGLQILIGSLIFIILGMVCFMNESRIVFANKNRI